MMPWTISTLSFETVDKSLIEAEPVDHEIIRVGADGTAFQVDAYRAATQEITTTVRKAVSAATQFRARCKALEATNVTVIDQHDWSWTIYVRRARVVWFRQIDGQYLIRVTWALVPQSRRPV
jgi:hypothetical protein